MKNWWYYYKWYVICGIVLFFIACHLIGRALGIGRREPDVQIAYVGQTSLPDDTVDALEQAFSSIAGDYNEDGDTVDLYDAQLYLLSGEYRTAEKAADNAASWLSAAKENYAVISEEDVVYDSVTYHVITYNCTSETNPYDRGISAFASTGKNAFCAELTCQADFADDLDAIMMDFLKHCTYL
jgi:hypothetical protein